MALGSVTASVALAGPCPRTRGQPGAVLGVSRGLSHPGDQGWSWAAPGCIPCQSKALIFQQEQPELWMLPPKQERDHKSPARTKPEGTSTS